MADPKWEEQLEKLLPVILSLAETFIAILMPALEVFLPVLDELSPMFDALMPIIESLIPIMESLAPIILMIAELMANNLKIQIKAITVVFKILAPIFQLIADIMTFLAPAIEAITDLLTPFMKIFQALSNPLLIVGGALEVIDDLINGLAGTLEDVGNGILDFISFWDPPGPCLAEAIDMSRESLAAMKDELHGLPNEIGIAGPSISRMTDDFTSANEAIGAPEEGVGNLMGGGAGAGKTEVNITIEGDVKDDETLDRIEDSLVGFIIK